MNIYVVIYSILSILLSLIFHNFFYRKALQFKINKANQKAIRWSSQKKPVAGGITFFLTFLFANIFFLLSQPVNIQIDTQYLYIAITLIFTFLIGLADDLLSISANLKLVLQTLFAILLISSGIYIKVFDYEILNFILSLIWYVGIMNSINMLDNMDAIATVVSITILSQFLIINIMIIKNLYELLIILAILFSLITFLLYNWHPSKMYMGDNGSLFLGLFLAIFGVKYLWNHPIYENEIYFQFLPFVYVLSSFLIPLTDTTTVTINRLLQKKSPFVGGKDHTTHALSMLGFSEKKIVLLCFVLNLIGTLLVTYMIVYEYYNPMLIFTSIFYCTVVILLLYINAFKINRKNKD